MVPASRPHWQTPQTSARTGSFSFSPRFLWPALAMLSKALRQQTVEKSLEGAVAAQLWMLFPILLAARDGGALQRAGFYLLETGYAP